MRNTILIGFASCYLQLVVFLCRLGAPAWLVNTPQMLMHTFVPNSFRLAAFGAWMRCEESKKGKP